MKIMVSWANSKLFVTPWYMGTQTWVLFLLVEET